MVEGTKCVKVPFLYSSHITELTYPISFTNWSLNCHRKDQGFYSNTFLFALGILLVFVCLRLKCINPQSALTSQ